MKTEIAPGTVFHRLTVISLSHKDQRHRKYYKVRCQCGTEKTLLGAAMVSGNTKSCGCFVKDSAKARVLPDNAGVITQIILGYKRHAKARGLDWKLTHEEVSRLVRQACRYCGKSHGNLKRTKNCPEGFPYNGLDRRDNNEHYTTENVVPCCGWCNKAKSNRSEEDFIEWIKTAAQYLKEHPL